MDCDHPSSTRAFGSSISNLSATSPSSLVDDSAAIENPSAEPRTPVTTFTAPATVKKAVTDENRPLASSQKRQNKPFVLVSEAQVQKARESIKLIPKKRFFEETLIDLHRYIFFCSCSVSSAEMGF